MEILKLWLHLFNKTKQVDNIFSVRLNHIKLQSAGALQKHSGITPIKIRIEAKKENRKQKQVHTGYACRAEVFKALWPKLGTTITRDMKRIQEDPEWIEFKKNVELVKNEWYNVVKDITMTHNPKNIWRLKQVEEIVNNNRTSFDTKSLGSKVELLKYHWELQANERKDELSKSSKTRYSSALSKFLKYHLEAAGDAADLKLYEIDKQYLTKWEAWMRNPEKQNGKPLAWDTVQGYAVNLLTVLDAVAINPQFPNYTKEILPIGSNKKTQYQIPRENHDGKINKFLDSEELDKFKDYVPEDYREELAKDVWFLSYYLGGLNSVDLVSLKVDDIQKENNRLVFYRTKNDGKRSKRASIVPLRAEAFELIKKYSNSLSKNKLLLNIDNNASAVALRTKVNGKNKREDYLKSIAKKIGSESLFYAMARHTMCTNFMRQGGTLMEVMQILGHSKPETTMGYLKTLNTADSLKIYEKI